MDTLKELEARLRQQSKDEWLKRNAVAKRDWEKACEHFGRAMAFEQAADMLRVAS
jgi:hypothetical protein